MIQKKLILNRKIKIILMKNINLEMMRIQY
jgi:hypothetical protein